MVATDLKSMIAAGKITINKKKIRVPAIDIPEEKMIKLRKIAALTDDSSNVMSVGEVVEYAIDKMIELYKGGGWI
jgi:ribosomal protein S4